MIINHNLNAMNAHRNMGAVTNQQGRAMEKLSSGLRINRAGDDAAGLAISEKMRAQIRGLNQASRNAQDGISMIQTAEDALSETQAISQRMRELAVQSANGTYTDEDRKLINQEFGQLKKEIDRIASDTEFNGSKVLNGEKSGKTMKMDGKGDLLTVQPPGNQNDIGKTEATAIFADVKAEDIEALGEGEFTFKFTRSSGNGGQGLGNELKIELIDNSKFNGNKEYVMDEVTIKDVTQKNGNFNVKLGGVEFNFKDLNEKTKNTTNPRVGGVTFTNIIEKDEDGVKLQVGANQDQMIGLSIENMRSRELGLGGIEVGTVEDSQEVIGRVDETISRISSQRADLGATQNRLEHTIASIDNTAENLQAAESRIRDVDVAKEMMNLTKLNVLQQTSQAMLSQANQAQQQVMSILG